MKQRANSIIIRYAKNYQEHPPQNWSSNLHAGEQVQPITPTDEQTISHAVRMRNSRNDPVNKMRTRRHQERSLPALGPISPIRLPTTVH